MSATETPAPTSDADTTPDAVTRLDGLASEPFSRSRYLSFFIDYIRPQAMRARRWVLTDRRLAHVQNYLEYEDFHAIGSAIVWKLTEEIQQHVQDVDPYVFSAWLNIRLDTAFKDAITEARRDAHEGIPDDEDEYDADIRTSVIVRMDAKTLLRTVARGLDDAPNIYRMAVGLFLVEELRQADVAKIAGVGQASVSRWIKEAAQRFTKSALNHVITDPTELDEWPQPTPAALDAERLIAAWVRDRYGVDAATWLKWVSDALSADAAYAVDLAGIAHGRMVHRRAETYDLEADIAVTVAMVPQPATVAELVKWTGWGVDRARKVLRIHRHRTGTVTRRNGHVAA